MSGTVLLPFWNPHPKQINLAKYEGVEEEFGNPHHGDNKHAPYTRHKMKTGVLEEDRKRFRIRTKIKDGKKAKKGKKDSYDHSDQGGGTALPMMGALMNKKYKEDVREQKEELAKNNENT